MNKGWAKFIYGNKVTLVEAGDTVMQVPGLVVYIKKKPRPLGQGNSLFPIYGIFRDLLSFLFCQYWS